MEHRPCERHASLYSTGPRSGSGYAVPNHLEAAYQQCMIATGKCLPAAQFVDNVAEAVAPDTASISSTERLRMALCLGCFGAVLMLILSILGM